jgi:hypothetical protein
MMNLGSVFAVKELWGAIRELIPNSHKEPLEQQMAGGFLPTFDDEAISAALDAALVEYKGKEHLDKLKQVRMVLKPHQRDRWRKVYGTIKLTERHEDVVCSEKKTTVEASTRGPAREDIAKEYQRLQRDYEYTLEDQRLQHLILVSEMARDEGVDKAKEYLITSDFAFEKSLTEQAKEKFDELKKAGGEKVVDGSYMLFLGREYTAIHERRNQEGLSREEFEVALKNALVFKTASERRKLEVAKKERVFHAKPGALVIVIVLTAVMIAAIGLIQFFN